MRDFLWGYFVGLLLGLGVGIAGAASLAKSIWHTETIRRGLAVYCPETGNWAWVGECEATK